MRRTWFAPALLVSIFFSCSSSLAATLYWGGASTSGVPVGGTGTWNLGTANWATDLSGTSYQAWALGGDIANFGGTTMIGTYTVTISNSGSPIPFVEGLNFAIGGYTLTGDPLALSGTPNIDVTQGAATIASVLDDGGSPLTITKTGAGLLYLNAANTFGTSAASKLVLANGYLRADSDAGALGTGNATLELQGGTLLLSGATGLSYNRNTTVSGNTLVVLDRGATGAGVTHTFGTLDIGSQTLNVFGTAYTNSGTAGLTFGNTNLTGNATFNVRSRLAGGSTVLTLGAVTGTNRNITTAGNGNVTFSSTVATGTGSISLWDGTDTFTNAVSSTGAFTVYSATAILSGASATLASPDIRILGGRLQIGNAISESNVAHFTGTPNITFGGGTLYLMQPGTTPANPVAETLGQLILKPGSSNLGLTGGSSGTHQLSFSSLGTRDIGGTFVFANSSNFAVQFSGTAPTLTNGILGGWAVRGQSWATVSGTGVDVASAAFSANTINTATPTDNITHTLTANVTMTSSQTINSLRLVSNATPYALDLNQQTLTLATGGLMTNYTAVTHRAFITNGTLTAGSTANAELFVMLQGSNGNGGQHFGIGAVVADNPGGAVNLVRGGDVTGVNFYLSGVNTYTGKTILGTASSVTNGNIVNVMTERQFGATPAVGTVVPDKMTLSNTFIQFSGNVPFSWAAERGITLGGAGGQINPGGYLRSVLAAPITGTGYFAFSNNNVETTLSGASTFDGPIHAGGTNTATNFTSIGNIGSATPNAMGTPSNAANGLIRQATPGLNFAGDGNNMSWVYVGGSAATTDRSFEFNNSGNSGLGASGAGTFTINGNVYLDATGATVGFNLTGTGLGILNGNIIQTTSGDSVVRKNSTGGTWRLTGQNNYTGVTSVSVGVLEYTTIGNVGAGPSSLGAPITVPNGTIALSGGSLRFVGSSSQATNRNLDVTGSATFDASGTGVLSWLGTVAGTASSARTLTLAGTQAGVISGIVGNGGGAGGLSLTKAGPGTWTLNGSTANTYTGGTTVIGGTLLLDYSNLTTPSNLVVGTSALSLSGGHLSLKGKPSAATTQTFAAATNTTVANTGSQITLDANGATSLALTVTGTFARNGGSTLNVATSGTTTLTASPGLNNGLTPWATYNGTEFATVSGGNIVAYSAYTGALLTTGGVNTNNYTLTGGQTQTGNTNMFALKITPSADAQTLAQGTFNLGVGGGGGGVAILYDGTPGNYTYNITGSGLVGALNQELYVHTARGTLNMADTLNSGTAQFNKAGAGTLILSGANTYSGQTNVNAGTLQAGSATAFSPNSTMNVNLGNTLKLNGFNVATGPLTGAGTVTNGAGTDVTLTFGNNTSSNSYIFGPGVTLPLPQFGLLTDGGTGKLKLNKIGSNLQALTGPNTFSGNITVNEGILAVPVLTDAGVTGPLGTGSSLTLGSTARQGGLSFYGTHNGSTNRNITLATNGVGMLDVFNTVNNSNLPLALSGAQTQFGDTAYFTGVISGSGQMAKTGLGNAVLTGTNTYTGNTNVVSGLLQFNSAAAIGGSGRSILVNKNGTVATGYALNQAFLDRIDVASAGVVALGADSASNLDFSSLPNVSFGSDVNFSFSGNLTPANSTYRLGGGKGALLIQKANAVTGSNNLVVSPNNTHQASVVFADAQDYTGTTTIQGTIYPAAASSTMASTVDSPATLIIAGGSAGIPNTSAITIGSVGTLRVVASAGDAVANKLGSAPITMTGGALEYRNDGSAFNFAQTFGAVTLSRGSNSLVASATAGTSASLTLAGLTRTAGNLATVDFNAPNTTTAQLIVTGGIALGEWATYGGQNGFADINGSNQVIKAAESAGTGATSGFASASTYYTAAGGANYTAGSGTARGIRSSGGTQSVTILTLGASDTLSVNALMSATGTNQGLSVGNNSSNPAVPTGTVQLASGTEFYVHTGGTGSPITINANLNLGSGTLVKGGSLNTTGNSLNLNGANTFSALVINTGVVVMGATGALPSGATVTLNGGQLIPFAGSTLANNITLNADATVGGNNNSFTHTGTITLNNNAMMQITTQGTQVFNGPISGTGGVYFANVNNGHFTIGGSTSNTYSGATWFYGDPNGGNTSPDVTLAKVGAIAIPGDVYLGWQTNSSVSGTSYPRNERLILGTAGTGGNQIADTAVIYFAGGALADAGSFELNTKDETIAGIHSQMTGDGLVQNTGATTTSTLTLAPQANKTYNFSGTMRDGNATTGKLALVMAGDPAGTQVLSAGMTYSGTTTVNSGTLSVNNLTGSGTGTGAVTVNGGRLAGIGSISGLVTVTSGSIAPGNSAGTLTLGGGLDIQAGANYDWEHTAGNAVGTVGVSFDSLNVTAGAVTIDATPTTGAKLRLNFAATTLFNNSFWDSNRAWDIITGNAAPSGSFDVTNISIYVNNILQGGGTNTITGQGYFTTAASGNNVQLAWTAVVTSLSPGSGVWKGGTDFLWTRNDNANNNWVTAYPSAAGHTATFDMTGAVGTVDLDGSKTIGKLELFTLSGGYTIGLATTSNTLSFDNTGNGNAVIDVLGGTHTVNAKVVTTTASNLDVNVGSSSLTLAQGIDNTSGKAVALSVNSGGTANVGDITTAAASTLSITGPATAGKIEGVSGAVAGAVTLTANATLTANRVRQDNLTISGSSGSAGAKLTINATSPANVGDASMVSRVGNLTIDNNNVTLSVPGSALTASQRAYYGTLDLKNNDLVVNNVAVSPPDGNVQTSRLSIVTDMIRSGAAGVAANLANPTWDGPGINSSYITPSSHQALGVMRNVGNPSAAFSGGNPALYTSFDGLTLSGNEILVKHTYYGDFDLDGKVSSFDFALLDAGFAGTKQLDGTRGWFFGDANYDGVVNSFDYDLAALGYGTYTGGGNLTLPEPSSLILGLCGVVGLLGVRRRRAMR